MLNTIRGANFTVSIMHSLSTVKTRSLLKGYQAENEDVHAWGFPVSSQQSQGSCGLSEQQTSVNCACIVEEGNIAENCL